MAEHFLSADPTHSRWNRTLSPRLTIDSGDTVRFECHDASGAQVRPGMTVEEFVNIDRNRIHALTGPIAIHNAWPGDVVQIDILDIRHKGWGWSSVIPGRGFLKQRFSTPFLFHWQLEREVTRSLAPATLQLRPFCGVMGVAPVDQGEFRTIPPGPFGGNMDVRELCAGAKLYLPVFVPGALFSTGDAHAAQGDGEVCINGIECPVDAVLRFHLHRNQSLSAPLIESAPPLPQHALDQAWIVVESGTDAVAAARAATNRVIDLLVSRWQMPDVHAYLLCSVALHLRLSQVVNEPMYTVSASIAKRVLPARELF